MCMCVCLYGCMDVHCPLHSHIRPYGRCLKLRVSAGSLALLLKASLLLLRLRERLGEL